MRQCNLKGRLISRRGRKVKDEVGEDDKLNERSRTTIEVMKNERRVNQ